MKDIMLHSKILRKDNLKFYCPVEHNPIKTLHKRQGLPPYFPIHDVTLHGADNPFLLFNLLNKSVKENSEDYIAGCHSVVSTSHVL